MHRSTRPARPLAAALAALFATSAGCGADPPSVPDVAPATAECKVPDPPAATPDPAPAPDTGRLLPPPRPKGALGPSGLKGLRPQDGAKPGLPLSLPQMMDARHPPSDMQWRALPPGSDAALTATVADAEADPKDRARAMHGLAVRAPEGGDAPMRAVLADPKADPTARRAAARALARGYVGGDARPAADANRAVGALIAALADDDARLRETAVKALAPHAADPTIRAALEARAGAESEPLVREALDAALKPAE